MTLYSQDHHCHILPGLDDGARSMAEALEMAEQAARIGYRSLIATPHYEAYFFENNRERILQSVAEFKQAVQRAGIPLQIEPGSEIMLGPEIPGLLAQKKLMTHRDQGTYVLVELPMQVCPLWADDILYRIQLLGLTPILAHPERYQWLEDDLAWLHCYKGKGMLIQANVSSLKGKYGKNIRKRALRLWQEDLVDFWGSDAHSVKGYEILESSDGDDNERK